MSNEYTVNIPINEYDRLRKIEYLYKESQSNKFIAKVQEVLSINLQTHGNFNEYISKSNELLRDIDKDIYLLHKEE